MHFLKDKAAEEKLSKQKDLRQKMNHAIKGSLRNLSLYLSKINVDSLNKAGLILELRSKIIVLANIHETIQDLERNNEHKTKPIPNGISLKNTLDLLMTSLRELFEYSDENFILDWSLSVDDDLPPGVCRDISNIVWELTINAEREIRKSGKSPYIEVRFEADEKWLTISVIDNGNGIDMDTFSAKTFSFGLKYLTTLAESYGGILGWKNNEHGGATMFTKLNINNVKPSLYANSIN